MPEDSIVKRTLPNSIEAEQAVIGSMLMDREAITAASELLAGEDFYQRQYGVMFDAMVELYNENKPVDLVTLQERLKQKDHSRNKRIPHKNRSFPGKVINHLQAGNIPAALIKPDKEL